MQTALVEHLSALKACRQCPNMIGPVVTHGPVASKVYLVGQAPGPREGAMGRPFAWTAGKTMFNWFEGIGLSEQQFRSLAYMAAVCRCFPGKAKGGADRVPSPAEIENCSSWMNREIELMQPQLVIAVGKLAIERFLGKGIELVAVVGKQFQVERFDHSFDLVPLPHPSGASTWFRKEPGKTLLAEALELLSQHPAWISLVENKD